VTESAAVIWTIAPSALARGAPFGFRFEDADMTRKGEEANLSSWGVNHSISNDRQGLEFY
jgi:hypothetical protein